MLRSLEPLSRSLRACLRSPVAWVARRRRRLRPDHHYLSICAIFKDEGRFLHEWITFHRNAGVEHFFLYNNNSSDGFGEALAEFECVTVVDWPYTRRQQRNAYLDCIRRFGGRSRWIAFIDIDEFLFAPGGRLSTTLRQFENSSGVLVSSLQFGTSGFQETPPLILPALTRRHRDVRREGKTIADPRFVRDIRNAHIFHYYGSNPYVAPRIDVIRINHYFARSMEEIHAKIRRGDAWGGYPKILSRFLEREPVSNEVEDLTILAARSTPGE